MSVHKLADYRKPTPAKHDLTGPRYFCLACSSDQFKLLEGGAVHCACCTARIRTLIARERK